MWEDADFRTLIVKKNPVKGYQDFFEQGIYKQNVSAKIPYLVGLVLNILYLGIKNRESGANPERSSPL